MALRADIKAALQSNLSAANQTRLLAGFLRAYHYTDGAGDPLTLPADNAAVADKVVDSIASFITETVRASERAADVEALTPPSDLPVS